MKDTWYADIANIIPHKNPEHILRAIVRRRYGQWSADDIEDLLQEARLAYLDAHNTLTRRGEKCDDVRASRYIISAVYYRLKFYCSMRLRYFHKPYKQPDVHVPEVITLEPGTTDDDYEFNILDDGQYESGYRYVLLCTQLYSALIDLYGDIKGDLIYQVLTDKSDARSLSLKAGYNPHWLAVEIHSNRARIINALLRRLIYPEHCLVDKEWIPDSVEQAIEAKIGKSWREYLLSCKRKGLSSRQIAAELGGITSHMSIQRLMKKALCKEMLS